LKNLTVSKLFIKFAFSINLDDSMPANDHISKFYFLIILFVMHSCASEAPITGGVKDVIPPTMLESIPKNGSINFDQKSIYMRFDEYIVFKDLNQKLIISPPISEKPNVYIKGKEIKIDLNPQLLEPNTTYSFNFNDAITDNNEGNALHSFIYAFSTGEHIDSLSFSGYVLNAFTREPITDAWVILHENLSDSAISTLPPKYLTKVDGNGKFLIPFIAEKDYKIYALNDGNYNYMFDLPTEGIAFIDSTFRPGIEQIPVLDTIIADSLPRFQYRNFPDNIELLLFTESRQKQFIKSHKRLTNDKIEIIFNSTQYEDFSIKVENDSDAIVYAIENPDTVNVWIKNYDLTKEDSLRLFITYTDPVFTNSVFTDTLKFKKADNQIVDTALSISANVGEIPYNSFEIFSNSPILKYDESKLKIEIKEDSIFKGIDFIVRKDSSNPLKLIADAAISEKSGYRIIVEDGFLSGLNNITNKVDTISVTTSAAEEFSNFVINFKDIVGNYIVELLQNKNVVEKAITQNGKAEFKYIKPGKYILRAIEDLNNNKRWDTGEYYKNLQPEPVYYYPSECEIRTKWNHNVDWDPKINVSILK
jgi:hypothetical protein